MQWHPWSPRTAEMRWYTRLPPIYSLCRDWGSEHTEETIAVSRTGRLYSVLANAGPTWSGSCGNGVLRTQAIQGPSRQDGGLAQVHGGGDHSLPGGQGHGHHCQLSRREG